MKLKMGRKTVLFGAHQCVLHPLFVALAWTRLYGVPRDPRLYVAFAVHDLGYFTTNVEHLDSKEGERHVEFGADLMHKLFGPAWGDFTRYHSRYYSTQAGMHYSRLCCADKLAAALEPKWLYMSRVRATGEIWEYLWHYVHGKYRSDQGAHFDHLDLNDEDLEARRLTPAVHAAMDQWHRYTMTYLRAWAYEHHRVATPEPGLHQAPPQGV